MMRDHGANAHPVIISAVAPTKAVYPNLIAGYLWLDTTVPALKRCTDADTPTYVNVETNLGAPTNVDYLVGTANGDLSAEIVVGTSPGGELGGTWASPTVDTTHSGSSHASIQSAAEATAASALATHEADVTTHGITAAAATVLDDASVSAMVDTLGGASSTGTGGLVRATSPTLVTPALGTPSALVLTNATGLPVAGGGTGVATLGDAGVLIGNGTGAVQVTSAGTAGQVLTSNGAGVDPTFQAATGGGIPIALVMTTDYISAARYDSAAGGSGAETFVSNNGAKLDTVSGATSKAGLGWLPLRNGTGSPLEGSPVYSSNISVATLGTDLDSFFGFGNLGTLDGGNRIVYTTTHIGFKILRTASGTASLYATQADGTTENASSALATVTATEEFDLIFKINSTTSVDYYTRENGGSLSSATNLTSNLPSSLTISYVQGLIANANTNTQSVVWLGGASFSR